MEWGMELEWNGLSSLKAEDVFHHELDVRVSPSHMLSYWLITHECQSSPLTGFPLNGIR